MFGRVGFGGSWEHVRREEVELVRRQRCACRLVAEELHVGGEKRTRDLGPDRLEQAFVD